ncbi:MAG TPA: phosphogluconate dehydratase, partial [Amaricoccus sp.]|nr:phosphogluconate dehydratase [Amaricoccus sp.]
MPLDATVARVTERIVERSKPVRRQYLSRMARAREEGPRRAHLSCGNQAHAYAAMPGGDKATLAAESAGNLGIVTAYNDVLSAHQPFETYPELIRRAARE